MKPKMPMEQPTHSFLGEEHRGPKAVLPRTDFCLHGGFGPSRGYSSPYDGESRRFYNLSRQLLIESAREQKREFFVLGLIVLACAWPVIAMFMAVVQVYSTQRP
jgi:hypothetical protein